MGCSRVCTKRRQRLVARANTEISVLPRNRDRSGGGSSRASSSLPRRRPSRLRWKPKRQSKFTANDRRSLSSRMPGSKSDVDSDNFDAGDKRRHRWRLPGLASVTTSSGGSAYGAGSMPQPPREVSNVPEGRICRLGPFQAEGNPVFPPRRRYARPPAPSCYVQR
jgi:hypothetical protein